MIISQHSRLNMLGKRQREYRGRVRRTYPLTYPNLTVAYSVHSVGYQVVALTAVEPTEKLPVSKACLADYHLTCQPHLDDPFPSSGRSRKQSVKRSKLVPHTLDNNMKQQNLADDPIPLLSDFVVPANYNVSTHMHNAILQILWLWLTIGVAKSTTARSHTSRTARILSVDKLDRVLPAPATAQSLSPTFW